MDAKDREFLDRLKATFMAEAEEHLRAISSGIVELEKESSPVKRTELIEIVYREAHSLKGAARSVGSKDVESVCHSLESAFAAMKDRTIALSPGLCDLVLEAVDIAARVVASSDAEGSETDRTATKELIRQLAAASGGAGSRELRRNLEPGKRELPVDPTTMPVTMGKAGPGKGVGRGTRGQRRVS